MIKNPIDVVDSIAMSDNLIKRYLKDPLIIEYNSLRKISKIESILPKDDTYAIILYVSHRESSVVSGHWTCITRHKGEISYFDSYGKPPDYPIDHWFEDNPEQQVKYLSKLLDKTKMPVFYNDCDYQSKADDISTCGRHVIFYLLNMLQKGRDLKEYHDFMFDLKKKTGLDYDGIVSYMINLI